MHLEDIDYSEMWREKQRDLISLPDDGTREERWDQLALFYQLWSEHDEYPVKLLGRIQIEREWSVLDIGCGTGVITIAAAIRARRVTAIDISARMLEILKTDATKRHLWNIRYIHSSWESMQIETDVEPHDVVITSRAIARTGDLRRSLSMINQAAIRYAYVTTWGGEQGEFIRAFREIIGRDEQNTSEDIYVYNILYQMGIRPNVEQIECGNKIRFRDLNQALQSYQVLFDISPEKGEVARSFLANHLVRRKNGELEVPDTRTTWSLISWRK